MIWLKTDATAADVGAAAAMVLAMVLADVGTAVAAMVAVVRAAAARKMAGEEVATAGMVAVGMATAVADSASTPCTQHIHILHYYATGVAITSLSTFFDSNLMVSLIIAMPSFVQY